MDHLIVVTVLVTMTTTLTVATQYEQPYYSHNNGPGLYGDMEWGATGLRQQKCIDIPANMSLCKDIGYHKMRLPNLLDHDTVREVTQQSSSWVPLLGIRCHPDTKLFLCSLFSPVCLDRPIWPCRTLCEAVKNGCESLMLKYGFPWPEMLRCDKFPPDNDLCIGLQHDNTPATEPTPIVDDSVCPACSQPDTYEAIVDNYCSAEFVVRVSVDQQIVVGDDLKLVTNKKKKKVKAGSLTKRDTRNLLLYLSPGGACDCSPLSDAAPGQQFLAMGARDPATNRLMVSYIVPHDSSRSDVRKAWKAMRKSDLCQNGLPSLPITPSGGKKKGGKKGRKGKKGNKRKEAAELPAAPSSDQPQLSGPQTAPPEAGKKRRKKCKNPKKCTSSIPGAATATADPLRRHSRDRSGRRKHRRGNGRLRN